MAILDSQGGTYQGYPCLEVRHKRSPGLRPDVSTVALDIVDFKELKINDASNIPWKIEVVETTGQGDINEFLRGTRAPSGPTPNPDPASGLNKVGDLILPTERIDDSGAKKIVKKRFLDMYIDEGGFQEKTDDLESSEEHREGEWQINITDIRAFWIYGALAQNLNATLRGGNFDPDTINRVTGQPFTAREVFEFLFSLVPGPGRFSAQTARLLNELDPPRNVIGEMNQVINVLQTLLDRTSLELTLLADNSIHLYQKAIRVPEGKHFRVPGALTDNRSLKVDKAYERKGITLNNRPPLLQVVGQRQIRRQTLTYVPVIQDQDGRWYLLLDRVPNVWKFPRKELHDQALNAGEMQYINVPPRIRGGSGRLTPEEVDKSFFRRETLKKQAFRAWGPSHLIANFREGITNKELASMPFLPMFEFGRRVFSDGRFTEDPQKGVFRTVPPIVQADRMLQDIYDIDGIEQLDPIIEAYVKKQQQTYDEVKRDLDELKRALKDRKDWLFRQSDEVFRLFASVPGALRDLQTSKVVIKLDLDALGLDKPLVFKDQEAEINPVVQRIEELIFQISDRREALRGAMTVLLAEKEVLLKQYRRLGGIAGWTQKPHGVIPQSDYSLDTTTGILVFNDIIGIMDKPFVFDRARAKLQDVARNPNDPNSSGLVRVDWGYELKHNSAFDWTSLLFMAEEQDPDKQAPDPLKPDVKRIAVVGQGRPATLKAAVEYDPSLRTYQGFNRKPLNLPEVIAQAAGRGASVLEPRKVEGFVYEFEGFIEAEPIATDCEWAFDGDVATTTLAVNIPGAPLAFGNQILKGKPQAEGYRVKEHGQVNIGG